jgi:hypothetical protein
MKKTRRAQLPFKEGGLCLHSAQRTRHAAHLASFADATRTLRGQNSESLASKAMQSFFRETPCIREGRDVVETTDSRIKPASMSAIATYISKAVSAVASDEELRLIPGTFDEVVAAPRQLQKLLTRRAPRTSSPAMPRRLVPRAIVRSPSCSRQQAPSDRRCWTA